MKFQNMRKGPMIGTDVQKRDDTEIVNLGSQTRLVLPGRTGEFDPKSRAVQIYAKAGYLRPTTKDGEAWLKGLKAEAE